MLPHSLRRLATRLISLKKFINYSTRSIHIALIIARSDMEKYRRWTDETAGINPFIIANTQKASLTQKVVSSLAIIVKGSLLLFYFPFFLVTFLVVPVAAVRSILVTVLLVIFGHYKSEGSSLSKLENRGKINIFLSNHLSFLDPLILMAQYPYSSFLGFSENEKGDVRYRLISSFTVMKSLLFNNQLFYRLNSSQGEQNLKQLLQKSKLFGSGQKLIVFYEMIRTNGKGTIKISDSLARQLYELEEDVGIISLKIPYRRDDLFNLSDSPLRSVLAGLSTVTPGNNTRVTAVRQAISNVKSVNELKDCVCMMANGAMLGTTARSYFDFLDFYRKTQQDGYHEKDK